MSSKEFRVLIAGGSIAGLTLANLLERLGISYTVLEAYHEMAPQVGASIGIQPNGARILDQVGLYDDVRKLIDQPLFTMSLRDAEGNSTSEYRGIGEQFRKRHGYDVVFVDRQMIIEVLWKNLKNKDRILVGKKVTRVSLEPSGVSVETADGQSYAGDILVGADGIHSNVRSEMWRLADALEPGYIPASEHTESLPTVYKCIFGISIMKEWTAGTTQTNFNKHFSYLVIGGPRNRVYWFLFVNMGKTHYGPELPRFSKEDEARLVQEHRDDKITKDLTFGELYAAKISSVLTPLPEYVFKKWHFNRIMTIGDAAHKLEPIAGQGGNSAIETAAVLANNLANLLKTCPPGGPGPTTDQIHDVFLQTQEKREPRVWDLVRASHGEQRIAAMESPLLELAARYLVPVVSVDDKLDPWGTNIEGGHKLDLLDTPRRPHATPFFDELASRPLGGAPATLPRLAVGAALCGILYVAQRALCLDTEALVREKSVLGHPLKKEFTGLAPVDALLSLLTSAFAEATSGPDLDWRLQSFYFLMNLIPVIYIWTLEGYRNGNHLSLVSWPWLFAAAYQLVGIGMVAPVYYLVSLYTTRRAVYSRPTGRPVPSSVAKVLPLCLVLGYVVPTILMFLPLGDGAAQQDVIAFWQGSPVYVAVLAWVLSGALARASPTKSLDWEIFETRDLAWLRLGYAFCFSAAATLHLSALAFARLSPSVSLVRAFADLPSVASMGLGTDLVGFWKYDMLLCFVSVAVWCLYSVYELRRLGYVTTRTAVGAAVATLAGQVLVGPGATYAALWAWREDVIAGLVKE